MAQAKDMFVVRMADLSDKIMDWFSFTPSEKDLRSSGKNDEDISDEDIGEKKSAAEVVHHEELKWSSPPVSKEKKSADKKDDDKKDDDDKMDLQRFAEEKIELFPRRIEVLRFDEDEIVEGLRLGIGLAFFSMALNGMSDDLLFNIPSSILMWMLGALSAAIKLEEKDSD